MEMTGAELLIQAMMDQGVDTIFGYPGGAVLNIYDALYDHRDQIHHVTTSHEQGAAHAADGYARATGKTGVCLATSGPGATNLVTGIATAYMDSVPMVAITGNVTLDLLGRDSFQEIDITGITLPITKHNFIVKDVNELEETVREAFVIANSDRPGPVLIDIPKDITSNKAEYKKLPKFEKRPVKPANEASILKAARLISEAKKPFIYAGGGVLISDASEDLLAFASKIDAPVSTSVMGLTAVPYNFPLSLGMIGMHGTPASNQASLECDLLIAVGSRFSDRVACNRDKFAPNAKILHIDIDKSEFSKNIETDVSIRGDAKEVLNRLTEALPKQDHAAWVKHLQEYKKEHPLNVPPQDGNVHPYDLIDTLKELVGSDAIIVTDVGQHQMYAAQRYPFEKPRTFLSSCGLGTMGYGFGAAIGAKTAYPDKPVILITGDGSFHMNMNELACAVSENLNIVVLIFDNRVLGMVRQWQQLFYHERYSCTSINRETNFVEMAKAFGADGARITKKDEIADALKVALSSPKPYLLDCMIDPDESVFPIIPPGKSGEDMIFG